MAPTGHFPCRRGYSGGTLDRPGIQRLLTEINAGSVDCVIVYTLDRLARMDSDFDNIVLLPRLYDVKVVALYPKPFVVVSNLHSHTAQRTHNLTADILAGRNE
jgi:DNA invertase Pin-like site-specific DNA recombinase